MGNILKLPEACGKGRKRSINFLQKLIDKFKAYQEKVYKQKVEALRIATYEHFINELKKQNVNDVQIPYFVTAKSLTEEFIKEAEQKGIKHINKCYRELKNITRKTGGVNAKR